MEASVAKKKRQHPTNNSSNSSNSNNGTKSTIPFAYRLHFSCDHAGKYKRSSKRIIVWRFGLTDLSAARKGLRGSDCRGEEHEVTLIWSVKSGKTKVFWNKANISHLFHEGGQSDRVEFTWEARSGDRFRIMAHAKPLHTSPQYNFLIGNVSFFSLPHVSELQSCHFVIDEEQVPASAENIPATKPNVEVWTDKATETETQADTDVRPMDLGFRLSMAGLKPSEQGSYDDLEDELTSEFFTNNLEPLRHMVKSMIPGTEDMVSRAIINAFSEDRDSQTSFDSASSCDSASHKSIYVEAESILETKEWVTLNVECAPRPDVEDQKRVFMQKQIDATFMHVRHERLSEEAAVRLLSSVATILGIRLSTPIINDTLIITDLDKRVEVDHLIVALCVYGEVKEAAVLGGRRFGVCRFCTEQGLERAVAASDKGSLVLKGKATTASRLLQPAKRPSIYTRAVSEPSPSIEKPSLGRRRSHQRNTITIDSVLTQTPFHHIVSDTPLVTPDASRSTLRPNVFTNIPARSSPLIFDAAAVVSPSLETSPYSTPSMIVRE